MAKHKYRFMPLQYKSGSSFGIDKVELEFKRTSLVREAITRSKSIASILGMLGSKGYKKSSAKENTRGHYPKS